MAIAAPRNRIPTSLAGYGTAAASTSVTAVLFGVCSILLVTLAQQRSIAARLDRIDQFIEARRKADERAEAFIDGVRTGRDHIRLVR